MIIWRYTHTGMSLGKTGRQELIDGLLSSPMLREASASHAPVVGGRGQAPATLATTFSSKLYFLRCAEDRRAGMAVRVLQGVDEVL